MLAPQSHRHPQEEASFAGFVIRAILTGLIFAAPSYFLVFIFPG